MANKINDEIKQKEFLKKKFKNIIVTYSIFAIIVFILVLLKKYSVISSNFYLIPFYLIMAIIAFGIMIVLVCQMEKICRKKEIGLSLGLNLVGIFLVVAFGFAIDIRKELIDFSKNATKAEALVYKDVEKDIDYHEERCTIGHERGDGCYVGDNRYGKDPAYYDLEFIYHLKYNVEDEIYTSTYRKHEGGKFSSEQKANSWKSKYNKGDYITIYYDNDNPESIKGDFALGFGIAYFFEVIAILFQIVYFVKHKKYMKEVVK